MSKPKWPLLGTMRLDKNGNRHFVLSSKITVLYDGEQLDLGQFRSAKFFDHVEGLNSLASKGFINDEELAERLETATEKQIKFDVKIPPPQTTQAATTNNFTD